MRESTLLSRFSSSVYVFHLNSDDCVLPDFMLFSQLFTWAAHPLLRKLHLPRSACFSESLCGWRRCSSSQSIQGHEAVGCPRFPEAAPMHLRSSAPLATLPPSWLCIRIHQAAYILPPTLIPQPEGDDSCLTTLPVKLSLPPPRHPALFLLQGPSSMGTTPGEGCALQAAAQPPGEHPVIISHCCELWYSQPKLQKDQSLETRLSFLLGCTELTLANLGSKASTPPPHLSPPPPGQDSGTFVRTNETWGGRLERLECSVCIHPPKKKQPSTALSINSP